MQILEAEQDIRLKKLLDKDSKKYEQQELSNSKERKRREKQNEKIVKYQIQHGI